MRKYNIGIKAAFAVFAIALSACSSDNDVVDNNSTNPETSVSEKTMSFSAIMDADKVTRTDFNSNSTIWTGSDAIKIANFATITAADQGSYPIGGVFNIVTHAGTAYTKEEVFTGSKIKSNGDGTDWFYAVYPTSCGIGYDDVGVNKATIKNASVPAQQTAVKGSYDQSLHFMTAYSNNSTFAFKNVCALLKITLSNYANIKRIRVLATPVDATKTNNTSYIAGDFEAQINTSDGTTTKEDGTTSVQFRGNNSPYVELQLPVSGDDCVEGTFYMVVLPTTISNGFTLFLEKTDGTIYKRVNTGLTKFERNKLYNLGTYDCSSTPAEMAVLEDYVDLGLPSGTLWCTKNITAGSGTSTTLVNSIYDNGGYYAWGDVLAYNQENSKGEAKTSYSSSSYAGLASWYSTDTLKYQRDAAYQIEGHLYCMPTYTQIKELYDNCTVTYYTSTNSTYNGHNGVLLTSKNNGNTLWLPAAGYHCDAFGQSGLNRENIYSHYWSRTLYTSKTDYAYCLDFDNDGLDSHGWGSGGGNYYDRRFCGKTIRPVLNVPAFK